MITSFPAKKIYNLGGYLSFQFVPAYLVTGYPAILNSSADSPIQLSTLGVWLDGYATAQTLSFDEAPVMDNPNGTYFNTTISGFVPGDKLELIDNIEQMTDVRFLVIIKDIAGMKRLIGSTDFPLEFSATFNSGATRSDTKGFNFKFTGTSLIRSPVYNW